MQKVIVPYQKENSDHLTYKVREKLHPPKKDPLTLTFDIKSCVSAVVYEN